MPSRRPIAAVIGGKHEDERLLDAAEALGRGLVGAGFRVATGGLIGVMEAASRGAQRCPDHFDGAVIGVLPTGDASTANPYVDIVIPTGMGYARNVLLVSLADVVIAVGGGAGTLSELAMAWQHDKPVIAVDLGDGWAARLAGTPLDDRRSDSIHRATNPEEAVALAVSLVGAR